MALKSVTKIIDPAPADGDKIFLQFGAHTLSLRIDPHDEFENYSGHIDALLFGASSILHAGRRADFQEEKVGCMSSAELLINLAKELRKVEVRHG